MRTTPKKKAACLGVLSCLFTTLFFADARAQTPASSPAPTPNANAAKTTSPRNVPNTNATNIKAPAKKTTYTISAEKYAEELRQSIRALDKWQSGALPTLDAARGVLPQLDERRVRRADGTTQIASGAQWNSFLDGFEYSNATKTRLTRAEIRLLRESVAQHLLALQRWTKGGYEPAAAQSIVSTLTDEGEIRVGPTATQLWWQNLKDSFANFWKNLFRRTATAATPSKPLNVNTRWVEWLFASCVLCLLGAIAWLVWKNLGGRWRLGARREVRFVGEDAELLQLPPDELLSRAARLARKGDFVGALRHRYIGVLVTLDERAVWRYDTRRTNWEHIAALRKTARWQTLTKPLSDLTRVFDRVRYGNAPVGESDWTQFDRDATDVEALSQAQSSTRLPAQSGARP